MKRLAATAAHLRTAFARPSGHGRWRHDWQLRRSRAGPAAEAKPGRGGARTSKLANRPPTRANSCTATKIGYPEALRRLARRMLSGTRTAESTPGPLLPLAGSLASARLKKRPIIMWLFG
jgi:hypothetical protein